jgi:hypothetical protein
VLPPTTTADSPLTGGVFQVAALLQAPLVIEMACEYAGLASSRQSNVEQTTTANWGGRFFMAFRGGYPTIRKAFLDASVFCWFFVSEPQHLTSSTLHL